MARQQRVQVLYTGRVQGVGFRYTTRQIAHGFEVAGFIKNLPDGRVELVVEGNEEELKRFLKEIGTGDLGPFIRNEVVVWAEPSGEFRDFSIRL